MQETPSKKFDFRGVTKWGYLTYASCKECEKLFAKGKLIVSGICFVSFELCEEHKKIENKNGKMREKGIPSII